MSEFKYVKVSWDELRVMTFEDVDKTVFCTYSNGKYRPSASGNLSLYAHEGMLYTRKKAEWHENVPKHGVLVWYKDVPVVVDYVLDDSRCICIGGYEIPLIECAPLTNEEVVRHYTGVKGE